MNINNFTTLVFSGTANGLPLQKLEPYENIVGKKIRIFRIKKDFYSATTNLVIEASASSLNPLTYNSFKVVKANQLIPKNSLGWNNLNQFFNIRINNNSFFDKDFTKNYLSVIEDLENISLETDIIQDIDVTLKVKHLLNYTIDATLTDVFCVVKLYCEII